jgi:hypothetical protein
MASEQTITCPMCGFKNPEDQERCRSCGAKVEVLSASYSDEEQRARRYQQEDFEWTWAALAAGVGAGLQALVLGLLPRLVYSFDPQGLPGLMLSVPVFFVAGVVLGLVSPGKTFVEPAVGSMIAAVPTLALVSVRTPEGFEATVLAYIVCAVMGVMMALFGAFAGERLQAGPQLNRRCCRAPRSDPRIGAPTVLACGHKTNGGPVLPDPPSSCFESGLSTENGQGQRKLPAQTLR